jgi:class 3 adenylate cyclase/tetratricopeptide (TPR) repeat protein
VLFADLVGSTSVAEQLDPEDWADVAEVALEGMSNAVGRLGGTVTRLMGDGLLALFGAPTAREDDAERAVRAGLLMSGVAASVRERATALGVNLDGDQLSIRVGIATGPVVAGNVGTDSVSEYTVLGDTPNLAARLEKLALPGSVLISDATRALVEHAIETTPLGPMNVRGKGEAVATHLATAVRADRRPPRGLGARAATVGRESELARLDHAVAAVAGGRGGIMFVFGEAGIGKSRLLEELRSRVADGHHTVALWHVEALSFETGSAYSLARRLLASLGWPDSFEAGLDHASEQRRAAVLRVLSIVGGQLAASSGELTADSAAMALGEVVTGLCVDGTRPVVLVVDDAQWADAASSEMLQALLGHTETLPLLLVFGARTDRSGPAWQLKQVAESEYPHRHEEIRLGPLGPSDAAALFGELVAVAGLPPERIAAITGRSEGNPFFLEEIVRELIQTGALVFDVDGWRLTRDADEDTVPSSLRRLLQARFDRLSPAARTSLEAAAVIGRTFSADLLARILGSSPDLHELLKVGLIEEDDTSARSYRFHHALGQESAYAAILQRRRKALHLRVGETIASEDPTGAAAVLASHFVAGGDARRAGRHAVLAGEEAVRLGAYMDAHHQFDAAIGVIDNTVDTDVVIRLYLGRGRSREILGDLDGSIADLDTALMEAERLGDGLLQWQVLVAAGEVWAARDYRRTGDFYRKALEVAKRTRDDQMVATSLNRLGNWHVNAADPTRGIEMHDEALTIFQSLESPAGVTASHDLLGMAHLLTGHRDRSRFHYREALDGFEALGDRRGMAGALVTLAIGAPTYQELAEWPRATTETAEAGIHQALDVASDLGWSAGESYARFVLCQVYSISGRLGDGIREGRRSLEIARDIGHDQWRIGALLCLGWAEGDALAFMDSAAHLKEAMRLAGEVGSRHFTMHVAAALGVTLVRTGGLDEAEDVIESALELEDAVRFAPYRTCRLAAAMIDIERGSHERAIAVLEELHPLDLRPIPPLVALVWGQALAGVDRNRASDVLVAGGREAGAWGMAPIEWRIHLALRDLEGEGAAGHGAAAARILGRCAASLHDPEARRSMIETARDLYAVEPEFDDGAENENGG